MKSAIQTQHKQKVANYYRLHSSIYDATRWSFLFGREELLSHIPDLPPNPRIMEVGCGTGKNLELLQYLFPDGDIYGVDLSRDMLSKARQKTKNTGRVKLLNKVYGSDKIGTESFDLILLSYTLTMMGEQTEPILQQLSEDLSAKGYVAVVDFHNTPFSWFKKWMYRNHVVMDGHLLQLLNKYFSSIESSVNPAYFGLWKYFMFIGHQG